MIIGLVGSEAAKFTPYTEAAARRAIRRLLSRNGVTTVVSGACHLGGIDIWAVEEVKKLGKKAIEHPPKSLTWTHYAERNRKIAADSDECYCITVDRLPSNYDGMRFEYCYHCNSHSHIKSGGCWTVIRALEMGKRGGVIVIRGNT